MSHRIYHSLHKHTGRRDDLWKNGLRGVLGRLEPARRSQITASVHSGTDMSQRINFLRPVHAPLAARSPALVIENEPRDILHLVFIKTHHLLFG